eukprot:5239832-Pyramimonas_sp.AAC.2
MVPGRAPISENLEKTEMIAMFDSESDASDAQTQLSEIWEQRDYTDKTTDAAAAKWSDKESMHVIAQPGKGQGMDRND